MYLDSLFDKDPQFALPYSDRLVELYAEYNHERLMPFLRASNFYDLEKALRICRERDYVAEMVFLLGRMGNNKQALMLIIERLGDVQMVSHLSCSFLKSRLMAGYRLCERTSGRGLVGGSTAVLGNPTRLYPSTTGTCGSRDQSNSADLANPKWPRDPRSEACIDQSITSFEPADLPSGRVSAYPRERLQRFSLGSTDQSKR
jgi:hypothetical protein